GTGTISTNVLTAGTSGDGLVLTNTTAATNGAQYYSPRLRLTGQGWKTNATAASQTVDWIMENRPVQDAANPSTKLTISSQINAGGYNERLGIFDNVTSAGTEATLTSAGGSARHNLSIGANNNVGLFYADGSFVQLGTAQSLPVQFITNSTNRMQLSSAGG